MELQILTETVKKLEASLHEPAIRQDVHRLNKLMADDFIEIGKSGKVWTRSAVIKALSSETGIKIRMTDFTFLKLSEDIVLVTYTSHQSTNELTSKRSSIWKLFGNEWKIIYHQGTPIK
jgi:hypothetical protein